MLTLNKTDIINIDFSKYPNLMNGICMTNFNCNNNICDLSTYHFIKYVRAIGDNFLADCRRFNGDRFVASFTCHFNWISFFG